MGEKSGGMRGRKDNVAACAQWRGNSSVKRLADETKVSALYKANLLSFFLGVALCCSYFSPS